MKARVVKRKSVLQWQFNESPSELKTLFKAFCAEMIGTAVFVFFSTAVVTSGCHTKDVAEQSGSGGDTSLKAAAPGSCFLSSTSALLNIALAFGFTLFVVIYFCASFSGGHINPAVTFAMFITRRISLLRGVLYVIAQCSGACIASIILKGLDPEGFKAAAGASNQVSADFGISGGAVLGLEIIMTFGLVFTVFAATDPSRQVSTAPLPILAPLSIGMIVFVAHLIMIPVDGCSINPARSLGPAAVSRTWNHFWIYWAGPLIGGMIAALIYELGFRVFEPEHVTDQKLAQSRNTDVEAGIPIVSHENTPVFSGVAGLRE
jgi:MIP family channel proteins